MTATLYCGSALDVLATVPERSVQTCVTSPPYWGLRDYGTALWEGGDGGCDHGAARVERRQAGRQTGVEGGTPGSSRDKPHTSCPCGAHRVDAQLGLERTPAEYVANMVEVFRWVWRALRDDGTLWLNLGSSYASGDSGTSPTRRGQSARAYDSDGIAPRCSPVPGSSCSDLCDGCRAVSPPSIAGSDRQNGRSPLPESPTVRGSGPRGSAEAPLGASPLAAPASTTMLSEPLLLAECSHCDNCGACLSVLHSASRDARLCARRGAYTGGSGRRGSEPRNLGMDASGMAWLNYTYKPKDLVPIPWLVAMALQRDGWYLRSAITWCKVAPMPESVTDRPTSATEMVFLLTKRPTYYYDQMAIAEPSADPERKRWDRVGGASWDARQQHSEGGISEGGATRNARNWWALNPDPFPGAHFAVMPSELARRCILAGSSAKACETCGAPWERVTEREAAIPQRTGAWKASGETHRNDIERKGGFYDARRETLGWQPTCTCEANTGAASSVVLDPFGGSGTTAAVAVGHGREAIHIDLNPAYIELARRRIGPMLCADAGTHEARPA